MLMSTAVSYSNIKYMIAESRASVTGKVHLYDIIERGVDNRLESTLRRSVFRLRSFCGSDHTSNVL